LLRCGSGGVALVDDYGTGAAELRPFLSTEKTTKKHETCLRGKKTKDSSHHSHAHAEPHATPLTTCMIDGVPSLLLLMIEKRGSHRCDSNPSLHLTRFSRVSIRNVFRVFRLYK
ncbi:unnamed protein product, partial [Scytosiphon promiscuus]